MQGIVKVDKQIFSLIIDGTLGAGGGFLYTGGDWFGKKEGQADRETS